MQKARVIADRDFIVDTLDRRGLRDVEALALRDTFRDVEHDDVAEFLEPDQMGERAADHTRADEGNLVACHANRPLRIAGSTRGRRELKPLGPIRTD